MESTDFKKLILQGIPVNLPVPQPYDQEVNHAPIRKDILSKDEKKLALKNALRYFDRKHHAVLAPEFAGELKKYGRIYMYRFRPAYPMHARISVPVRTGSSYHADDPEQPRSCSRAAPP